MAPIKITVLMDKQEVILAIQDVLVDIEELLVLLVVVLGTQ